MPASYATHRKQLELILQAWGMPEETADSTAEIMSWADLHGIDTHGISMVPLYDERRRAGKIDMRAVPTVARETPVSALIDGGGGLGHPNARRAMELAIDKAKTTRHRRRGGAQLGAFRRLRLLRPDGGRGRADRHGDDLGERHPGRADLRRAGAARHRPDRLCRARQARRTVPARHGDHDGGRRQDPQQGERESADAAGLAGHQADGSALAPIRSRSARAAS